MQVLPALAKLSWRYTVPLRWRDDIRTLLNSIDLLVVASLPFAEATTRVIPEAYSAGVPVLASNLPGISEILQDGETGFLIDDLPCDAFAAAVVDAFRRLIDDPGLLQALSTGASRTMTRNWQTACDDLVERLIAVIKRNRALKSLGSDGTASAETITADLF